MFSDLLAVMLPGRQYSENLLLTLINEGSEQADLHGLNALISAAGWRLDKIPGNPLKYCFSKKYLNSLLNE